MAVVRLAEAGSSDAESQAITIRPPATIAQYHKRAKRKQMPKSTMQHLDRDPNPAPE
ncbi:hypothetical protein [Rhodobacter viridis]|uniref:hypothetical protein n=1 Tax=Rhodobacter viridis TaxID=1054202 RepID=UPI001C645206|nr:hypothetical protein [Rhodobacter viridis]